MLTSMTEDSLADFAPKEKPVQPRRPTFETAEPTFEKAYDEPLPERAYDPVMAEKLNRLIQLLEDQRDEKTGYVTEEIILYMFLGVFVIFVLDSFVKTGKYSR